MVENSRIRYQQWEKQNGKKIIDHAEVKNILYSCIHEYFQGLEFKKQKQTNKITELVANIDKKLDKFKCDRLWQEYSATIDEGQTTFSPALVLKATDADESSLLKYTIEEGNVNNLFTLER